jgi:CRP-like cAMP-binding protein
MEQITPSTKGRSNRLLQMLSRTDRELLEPHLESVSLERNDVCIEPGVPIEHVYFLEGGLSSTVVPDKIHGTAELGTQGYEGLIGVPAILGADRSPHRVFMQVGGPARRIGVECVRQAMDESPTLRKLLLLYVQVFMLQVGQTAYANARYSLEERLARWILMSADRLGPQLFLTHEFLSFMLGVRRPGVTTGLHVLEGEGLIRANRGTIFVLNRAGLEKRAGGCYGVPEAEYERLIGPWR